MREDIAVILDSAKKGDQVAFAKLLTHIESIGVKSLKISALTEGKRFAFRIGITGPPGAGKSTLISGLLQQFSQMNLKVGVLAIDPTSPITQGAILGDRIRFSESAFKSNVFVRSLGSRGSLGGLCSSAYLMLRAFDYCDFDLVIVETVGVGQVEVEIMNVADLVCLVLVPESGDSMQILKAGLMEIADLFVVNKSDRPGAQSIRREIESHLLLNAMAAEKAVLQDSSEQSDAHHEMMNGRSDRVLMASALNNEGVREFAQKVLSFRDERKVQANRKDLKRLRAEGYALLRSQVETEILGRVNVIQNVKDLTALF